MRKNLGPIARGLPVLIVCAVLGGLLGLAAASLMTPSYVATSTAYVRVAVTADSGIAGYSYGTQIAQDSASSFIPVITSVSVAQAVAEELGLSESADEVASWVSASHVTETRTIRITVEAPSRERAIQVANALVEQSSVKVQELEGGTHPVSLAMLTPAELSPVTKTPSVPTNVAIGVVGGLLVGVVVLFVVSTLRPAPRRPRGGESGSDLSDLSDLSDHSADSADSRKDAGDRDRQRDKQAVSSLLRRGR